VLKTKNKKSCQLGAEGSANQEQKELLTRNKKSYQPRARGALIRTNRNYKPLTRGVAN
jgi:hypothetical protein